MSMVANIVSISLVVVLHDDRHGIVDEVGVVALAAGKPIRAPASEEEIIALPTKQEVVAAVSVSSFPRSLPATSRFPPPVSTRYRC